MGLDITVIKTKKDMNLKAVYAIFDAVSDNFDWYLGNDRDVDSKTWKSHHDRLVALTRADVIASALETPEEQTFLESIPEAEFDEYLDYVKKSVSEHTSGNSHLHFDWEKLPGEHITYSCSGNLWELLKSCGKPTPSGEKYDDTLIELDPNLVMKLTGDWQKKHLTLIKVIGYFFPTAARRMVDDCITGVDLCWCDINELMYYRNELAKVADKVDSDCRIWVVASY